MRKRSGEEPKGTPGAGEDRGSRALSVVTARWSELELGSRVTVGSDPRGRERGWKLKSGGFKICFIKSCVLREMPEVAPLDE